MINDAMIEAAAGACREITFNALTMDECRDAAKAALTAALPLILSAAAQTGYRTCAETRHVTLGRKVDAAIRAMGEKAS